MPLTSQRWGFPGGDADAARAKILGGCSSHNACFVVWSAPGDHERWLTMGSQGWSFQDQLPHIRRAEETIGAHVFPKDQDQLIFRLFHQACEEVGYPSMGELNDPSVRTCVAPIPRNIREGVRWNAAFAYLDPARRRPNLTIWADTLVDRVDFDATRASCVVVRDSAGERRISAGTVVLCAGAYLSPAVLLRSGIGPPAEIARLDLPVRVGLEGVGANLIDHPYAGIAFEAGSALEPLAPLFHGPMLKSRSSLSPDEHWDTHVIPYVWWLDVEETRLGVRFDIFAVESGSVGRVRLRSLDPEVLPDVEQPWEQLADADLDRLLEGIDLVRRLGVTKALEPYLGAEVEPGVVPDLASWVRSSTGGYWHPVGTCRMGAANDPGSVVDATGRVHGVEHLVVADASIFPTVPRANTNLPTLAAAEFIASSLLQV
jgi:choline dehydrogenase